MPQIIKIMDLSTKQHALREMISVRHSAVVGPSEQLFFILSFHFKIKNNYEARVRNFKNPLV